MANVTIKKTGNSVRVNFNDYSSSPNVNSKKRSYCIFDIVELDLVNDESHIVVLMRDAHGLRRWHITWDTTYSGDVYFIVDSVDQGAGAGAEIPANQSDLFDKLEALRG